MCGPSAGTKAINAQIQGFSKQLQAQAGTIFGDASSVFNNITNAMQGIVNGGPSQQGMSAAELSSRNAAAVNAGAAEARNLKAAAASSVGAIGGGNTVTSSGTTQAAVLNAQAKAASDTANMENEIQSENYGIGRENFFKAAGTEENAMSGFSQANQAGSVADEGNKTAFQSQQEMDQQSNWAMNDVMKLGSAAVQGLTSAYCSAEGSMYLMGDGSYRPVERLHLGEMLLGQDDKLQTILRILRLHAAVLRVVTSDGNATRCSITHGFATPDGNFISARNAFGHSVVTENGIAQIVSVEQDGWATIYSVITDGVYPYQADGIWMLGMNEAEYQTMKAGA